MILVLVAAFTVTFSPSKPTVGDAITVTFPAPVVLDASTEYEVVSRDGNTVVVRTFTPKPIELRGVAAGNVRFANVRIPVQSVLRQGDDLTPAPLVPPRAVAQPRLPWIAIALAALAASAAWVLVWRRGARVAVTLLPQVPPDERFRRAVLELRANASHPRRWASLADETRLYLAATRPHLGIELTTTEVLPRLAAEERIVVEILRQGDLEKFSPAGRGTGDFDAVADAALELAREPQVEEAAA
jgi:hypothetical protein